MEYIYIYTIYIIHIYVFFSDTQWWNTEPFCYWLRCHFSQDRALEVTKNAASRREFGATSKVLNEWKGKNKRLPVNRRAFQEWRPLEWQCLGFINQKEESSWGWRALVARKTPLCFGLNSSCVQEVAPCFSCWFL